MDNYKPLFTLKQVEKNLHDKEFEPMKPMQAPSLSDEEYAKLLTIPQPIGNSCFYQNYIIDKIISKQ